jgi:HEPN domain-containing protein
MKQTAVEWLIDMLVAENEVTLKGENFKLFEMAKAMEKEQIISVYWDAYNEGKYSTDKTADEYYNQTFKEE